MKALRSNDPSWSCQQLPPTSSEAEGADAAANAAGNQFGSGSGPSTQVDFVPASAKADGNPYAEFKCSTSQGEQYIWYQEVGGVWISMNGGLAASAVSASPKAASTGADDFSLCGTTDADWTAAGAALISAPSDPAGASQATDLLSQDLVTLAIQARAANSPDAQAFISAAQVYKADSILLSTSGTVAANSGDAIAAARAALAKDCGLGAANEPGSSTAGTASTTSTASQQLPSSVTSGSDTSTAESGTATGAPAPASTPVGMLSQHWQEIAAGNFSSAWSDFVPGSLPISRATWIAQERADGVESATFVGHQTSQGSSVSVTVDSMIVRSTSGGCQQWSGSYDVQRQGGRWLIAHAGITAAPCQT